ncbi:MAG TPA: FAD:protein FMN transferase [Planctomycetota bacterium]|nr:FAD:protein FMN transferase [Planctomycetota bacterium]
MLHRAAIFAMHTRFELVLEGRDETQARAASEAALAVIEACDARWSRFQSDSLVSRINRDAGAHWVRVDPETFDVLERCLAWKHATRGAFDVAVGAPMDRVREDCEPAGSPAGAFELDATRSSVRFTIEGTQLDFGGVGKGAALDLAAEALREAGIERALLHGGTSSVLGLGAPPESPEGWPIGLGVEFEHRTVMLRDRALSISAARGSREGSTRVHVVDPRSGFALLGDSRCAVVAPTAAEAEAWSTALLVLAARGVDIVAETPPQLEFALRPALGVVAGRARTLEPARTPSCETAAASASTLRA